MNTQHTPRSIYPALLCLALLATAISAIAEEGGILSGDTPAASASDWEFIDNGKIRLGIKKTSGGGIAWFSKSGGKNLVNHWDHGRLIQQSYYGAADDSFWNDKPWRWNPVQGGDWKGNPARVLEVRGQENHLYVKTLPKHWASGADLDDTRMEQWITLEGDVAHIRFKISYSGEQLHPKMNHEIPAVFLDSHLETLVLYDGDTPWTDDALHRSVPGWPNESRDITEHWAAYVDADDHGLGVYVPIADSLTCYRFSTTGQKGACSYFAPLTNFAFTPGTVFEYDLYLSIGSISEIRQRFHAIAAREE